MSDPEPSLTELQRGHTRDYGDAEDEHGLLCWHLARCRQPEGHDGHHRYVGLTMDQFDAEVSRMARIELMARLLDRMLLRQAFPPDDTPLDLSEGVKLVLAEFREAIGNS